MTIASIALFVLNFLNLPQGDILTKAEKYCETLKDTSLPLPIWYQDGLANQWKSNKLILQGKGYVSISPDVSNELTWLPLQKIQPKGTPSIQTRDETAKTPGGKNSNTSHGDFKNSQKRLHSTSLTLWSPYVGTDNQAENPLLIKLKIWFLNREYLRILKIFFFAMLGLLAFASPAQADLIDHTYWAYIPNSPFLL